MNVLVREHPRLPCVKGAGSRVSRKRETEGLSNRASLRVPRKVGVLIPSAPVCALGQLPLISKGSLLPTLYTRGALRFARKCPDTNKKR